MESSPYCRQVYPVYPQPPTPREPMCIPGFGDGWLFIARGVQVPSAEKNAGDFLELSRSLKARTRLT